jgi:hypothetical protein
MQVWDGRRAKGLIKQPHEQGPVVRMTGQAGRARPSGGFVEERFNDDLNRRLPAKHPALKRRAYLPADSFPSRFFLCIAKTRDGSGRRKC